MVHTDYYILTVDAVFTAPAKESTSEAIITKKQVASLLSTIAELYTDWEAARKEVSALSEQLAVVKTVLPTPSPPPAPKAPKAPKAKQPTPRKPKKPETVAPKPPAPAPAPAKPSIAAMAASGLPLYQASGPR